MRAEHVSSIFHPSSYLASAPVSYKNIPIAMCEPYFVLKRGVNIVDDDSILHDVDPGSAPVPPSCCTTNGGHFTREAAILLLHFATSPEAHRLLSPVQRSSDIQTVDTIYGYTQDMYRNIRGKLHRATHNRYNTNSYKYTKTARINSDEMFFFSDIDG